MTGGSGSQTGTKGPRLLVLGGSGLLGHKLMQVLGSRFETWATVRSRPHGLTGALRELFDSPRVINGIDAMDVTRLENLVRELHPAVVVNAVGAIKQRPEGADPVTALTLNALLPHRLSRVVAEWSGRLIHFSTDCVFSGSRGQYREDDVPDATDVYGRTKFLGEVTGPRALTLRTSFIGREVQHHQSLLDWLLAQNHGSVRGFTRARWSGVTSNHLASLVGVIIADHPGLHGLYQVAGQPISKHDLLVMLRDRLHLDIAIARDDSVVNDRTMSGAQLSAAIGYRPPAWEALIEEVATDPTAYTVGA